MSPTSNFDVSVVITFHREGVIAHKSLLSLGRCRLAAEQVGISVEIVATLDRADITTKRVVTEHLGPGAAGQILTLDMGDLGLSRNAAIAACSGRWILICDGDDYLSSNFIVQCVRAMKKLGDSAILHPELIITFEAESGIWWQIGSDDPTFDPACMLVCNPWNACCFSAKSTFTKSPYALARPGESGFGFEDWHWNCETLSLGHAHLIADKTVHYVRKKTTGSLNKAHIGHSALIPPTRLFDLS